VSRTPFSYASVRTLFLDVGHTLVAPDFAWMARELAQRGAACDAAELERADAELRPELGPPPPELAELAAEIRGAALRAAYLERLLARLPHLERRAELARALVPVLYPGGFGDRLWSVVIPGVPEALERFARLGLRMVVVSNADGTVERMLVELGMRAHFAAVIDSHVVGVSKPDPGIFEIALARGNAERKHTLHVGDTYDADVLGARSAGLEAVLLDRHGCWGPRDCDRFPDLLELAARLEQARGEA
jgi:putative hydrolase of the HAD superfamily